MTILKSFWLHALAFILGILLSIAHCFADDQLDCSHNSPPVARLEVPQIAFVGEAVEISSCRSSDPDGYQDLSQSWFNYGDGIKSGWRDFPDCVFSHVFTEPGTYMVRLWVRDICGVLSHPTAKYIWIADPQCDFNETFNEIGLGVCSTAQAVKGK